MDEITRRIEKARETGELDLRDLGLTEIPETVFELTNIRQLILSGNHLLSLSPKIIQLRNLELFYLDGNDLQSLPPEIGQLTNLSVLSLPRNQLHSLPAEIGQLTNLYVLNLLGNQLQSLPPEIGQLVNLRFLELLNNHLQSLPPRIGLLSNLLHLDVGNNQLQLFPPEIVHLTNLHRLSLCENQLEILPPKIGMLTKLKQVNLQSNRLQSLPPELAQLTNLQNLLLQNNKLQSLPPELGQLTNLQDLDLGDNPIEVPPLEIISLGKDAIFEFLRAGAFIEQWISKLVLIGEGDNGKTCLLKRLRGIFPDGSEITTVGIEIHTVSMQHKVLPEIDIEFNAWDFGGQEILHATHQFFITPNSLFLLVWKPRTDTTKLWYWLDTINVHAKNARVIIVATHKDQGWPADLPHGALKEKYGQMILGSFEVSCISREPDNGIEELLDFIATQASKKEVLPHLGRKWPGQWLKALNELRKLSQTTNYLSRGEFTGLLDRLDIPKSQHRTLGRYLHELGEIIYHDDDPQLRGFVLLNSQWVSNIVCRVLQSREVANRKGVLTRAHLDELWRELPEEELRHFMHRLMERFDLAYEVRTDTADEISLVVERVPHDPTPECSQIWQAMAERDHCHEIAIQYKFNHQLTAGVPTWLIARQHRFSIGEHWRRGVLFADRDTQRSRSTADAPEYKHLAMVEADPEKRTVHLRVRGPRPAFFFSQIKDGFEDTLRKLPNPDYRILVPCPGHNGADCTGEFRLEKLDEFEERGKLEVECPETGEDVPIHLLRYGLRLVDTARKMAEDVDANRPLSKDDISYLQLAAFGPSFRDRIREDEILPFIFWLRPFESSRPLREMLRQKFYLHLCCECPGFFHPITTETGGTDPDKGRYLIEDTSDLLREWGPTLEKIAEGIDLVKKPLSFLIKTIAGIPDAPDLGAVPKLTGTVPKSAVSGEIRDKVPHQEGLIAIPDLNEDHRYFYRAEGATYRQLTTLILKLDEKKILGNLWPTTTPEGYPLMMCKEHHEQYHEPTRPIQELKRLERRY